MHPEKIDLSSATISDDKLAQLRDLLPEVFHEGKINFDELKNALGEYVEDDPANERFGLRWPGKSNLQQVINTPSVGTLVPQPEESVDWDDTGNIIIEGDNLEVLKLLQKSYAGKVKMIYIDPPYNTGNDFVYPDKYASGLDTYLEFTGQTDEAGKKLASNSDTSGRYHANWLNMMYPRLYLARNLLRQDGVIFVSIDDAELAHLVSLMDGIFGEDGKQGVVIWEKVYSPRMDVEGFSTSHDYLVVYSRSSSGTVKKEAFEQNVSQFNYTEEVTGRRYRRRSLRKEGSNSLRSDAPGSFFPLEAPDGTLVYPVKPTGVESNWRWSKATYQKENALGNVEWVQSGSGWQVYAKQFHSDSATRPPETLWKKEVVGHSHGATHELGVLLENRVFDNPKPVKLVQKAVSISHSDEAAQDIILDFFAGSGTTGHAVMQQNAEDGGNRKYIMVQLPEPMEPKKLDDGTQLNTIADIARERVRRAGRKIKAELPQCQGGGGVIGGFYGEFRRNFVATAAA